MHAVDPDSAETRRLLEEIATGRRPAFDELFARHRLRVRRFVAFRLDPRIRARVDDSDIVQETQLEAFQRLDDYLARRPMPFHLWLRKTAYERLLKIRRQHVQAAQRSVDREVGLPDRSSLLLAKRLFAGGSSPSEHMARQEIVRRVRTALAQLGEVDREILLMRTVDELSYEEAACILDLEPPAARKRYGRALLRLRKLLFDDGLFE